MKKVLSLLVAFVVVQTQCWALSGGPVYSGDTAAVSGTYAGVMTPTVGVNTLGIFVIGVPKEGLASGAFAMFTEGKAFYGSILGLIDPDKLTMNALANAQQSRTSTIVLPDGSLRVILTPQSSASGALKAKLQPSKQGSSGQSGYRLKGSGVLSTEDLVTGLATPDIVVSIDGFQQSANVSGTVNVDALTGTQSTSAN